MKALTEVLHNDEGMWLPNRLPLERLKELYDFVPGDNWAEEVMKSCVRINDGGSASFVSANGLVATNHHVAAIGVLPDLSSPERDLIKDGYCAKNLEDELPAANLEVNVLWEIEDVTDRVKGAIGKDLSPEAAHEARNAIKAVIEKESLEKTGLRSDVVTLYQGGRYHLYRYKRYRDVRLVFAPERNIAAFGGDFDNFEYPRYCLDITFLRVYEDGKPLATPHHFRFNTALSSEKDILFVAGHPGTTSRLKTADHVAYMRDESLPRTLALLYRLEISYQQFAGRSPEHARRVEGDLHSIQNSRKVYEGQLRSVQEPGLMKRVHARENTVRAELEKDAALAARIGNPWEKVSAALALLPKLRDEYGFFEGARGFRSEYFNIARAIIRLAEEDKKPNDKRLPEYGEARRASLLDSLLAKTPIYSDLEEWKLSDSLAYVAETFGFEDTDVSSILNGMSPQERAYSLIQGTLLDDPLERKKLIDGGSAAVAASADSMIKLALSVDARARRIRKEFETKIDEVLEEAHAKIAEVLFELYGEDLYPDATFTLRFAYGRMIGYQDSSGAIPSFTKVKELLPHGEKQGWRTPWVLPPSWEAKKDWIASSEAAFDFISTHDTHGGNSGSPVFTKNREFVGILFDGNLQGMGDTFVYRDESSRSLSVHAAVVMAALTNVYRAERLVKELLG